MIFGGLAMLAEGMERHRREVGTATRSAGRVVLWRLGGAAALTATYPVCVSGFGLSVGVVVWLGLASLAMTALVFGSPVAPRRARQLLPAATLVGVAIVLLAL